MMAKQSYTPEPRLKEERKTQDSLRGMRPVPHAISSMIQARKTASPLVETSGFGWRSASSAALNALESVKA
jgi:hypothetical protein